MLKFKKPKIPIILKYTILHYQIAINYLTGMGAIKTKELVESDIPLEELFEKTPLFLEKTYHLSRELLKKMKRSKALEKSIPIVESLKNTNINTIFYTDKEYPHRLKSCADAPVLLYTKGKFSMNEQKMVAIVGTRDATEYGKNICEEIIKSFKGQNIVVVSGLAHGIDAYVHRFCLKYDVPTIGVLGNGLDSVYPAIHRELAHKMVNNGGLVSELIPGTKPDRQNFPLRNRIVAGMTDATIVVESKKRGGSLITANLSNDYSRDVFAFPGSVHMETSQGCNLLISQQKAHLIQNAADFLRMMNWKEEKNKKNASVQHQLFINLTDNQEKIVNCLRKNSKMHIDFLSMEVKMPISILNQELFTLEMNGVVRCLPGKVYVVC